MKQVLKKQFFDRPTLTVALMITEVEAYDGQNDLASHAGRKRYSRNDKTGATVNVNGPARLAKFLGVDDSFNNQPASRTTGLWFEDRGVQVPRSRVAAARRVGVAYAGPIWGEKEWNFKVNNDSFDEI